MISDLTKKLLTINKLKDVGDATLGKIIKINGYQSKKIEEIAESEPKLRKAIIDSDALKVAEEEAHVDFYESKNIGYKILSVVDEEYPEILRQTSDRPFFLHIRGQMPKLPSVAIIGTREPTHHGRIIAERISQYFSENGWSIVSGLALGCDTIAHLTAVKNKSHTTAVLAHGLDTISPKSNEKLSEEILSTGGTLLTQYEFGTKPKRYHYAQRDKIQAGLSQGVIMIQSDIKGGSLHASRAAIKYGRILAVPNSTDLDKKNKEHKIEANLVLAGSDNDAKADLLQSGPLECQNIFVINSKDDYELLKNKLMEQYE